MLLLPGHNEKVFSFGSSADATSETARAAEGEGPCRAGAPGAAGSYSRAVSARLHFVHV